MKDSLQHESAGVHVELPLDRHTIERFNDCKEAKFPICLDRAVTKIFGNKELMVSIAEKAGFKSPHVSSPQDVWALYTKLGSSWEKVLGNSVTAVIGFESLKEMEAMCCTKCPLYEIELERKNENYAPKHSD